MPAVPATDLMSTETQFPFIVLKSEGLRISITKDIAAATMLRKNAFCAVGMFSSANATKRNMSEKKNADIIMNIIP